MKGDKKMTLRDLSENMEIVADIVIKKWNYKEEKYIILAETGEEIVAKGLLDADIKSLITATHPTHGSVLIVEI